MTDEALDVTGVVVGASVVVALVGTDVSGVDAGSPSPPANRATPADHRGEDEHADEHNHADSPRPLTLDDVRTRSARHRGRLQIEQQHGLGPGAVRATRRAAQLCSTSQTPIVRHRPLLLAKPPVRSRFRKFRSSDSPSGPVSSHYFAAKQIAGTARTIRRAGAARGSSGRRPRRRRPTRSAT